MPGNSNKILIVSTFPPKHCGIGTYAHEQMLWYKRNGWIVYQQAPDAECSAHFRIGLGNLRGLIKFWLNCWMYNFDSICIHYLDDFMFPSGTRNRLKNLLVRVLQFFVYSTLLVFWGSKFQIVFHEIDNKNPNRLFHLLRALVFPFAENLQFHTDAERTSFLEAFKGWVSSNQTSVVDHGRYMSPKYHGDKAQARAELNLPSEKSIFLCIGFLQRHKNFKQVITCFQNAQPKDAELNVVGSMRVPAADIIAYRDELLTEAQKSPDTVHLIENFVSDVDFDRWLKAADVVILPYEEIWSSGVGARAQLLGAEIWIRRHPNLVSQFSNSKSLMFTDWGELEHLFANHLASQVATRMARAQSPGSIQTSNRLSGKRMLFVMPWFGSFAKGGAEKVIFELCEALSRQGVAVTVWTTKSTTLENWNNLATEDADTALPFGVRRFSCRPYTEPLFKILNGRLNGAKLGLFGGWLWQKTSLYGPNMRSELESQHESFDAIVLCHYLGGTTHNLANVCPQKILIYPFIHDEPALYNRVMRDAFAAARGVVCNSAAEVELGQRAELGLSPQLFTPVGNIVEQVNTHHIPKPSSFQSLTGGHFVLFLGRLISEKNLQELIHWHSDIQQNLGQRAPKLVFAGKGDFFKGREVPDWMLVTGSISEDEKSWLLQNCLMLVQPSLLESFSLVIMEAWLLGKPVCVHSKCLATLGHVKASGGGQGVINSPEYSAFVRELLEDPSRARALGEKGQAYVQQEFSELAVLNKFSDAAAKYLEWQ